MEQMKTCRKCGEELPATTDYFNKRKDSKDGMCGECKKCQKKYREENKYNQQKYEENRRANRKEHTATVKKIYQSKNKDKVSEYGKKYYHEHKERIAAYKKKYKAENRDYFILAKQKRRALEKILPATLTTEQWEQIKLHFENSCCYCGATRVVITLDHFQPLSRGGELSAQNALPACKFCNSSKHDKLFESWYPTYKHYSKSREKKILDFLNYKNGVQQLTMIG